MAILSSLFTGSLQTTGSFGKVFVDGTVTASEYKGVFDGALSSSAQISDDISGSFTAVSGGYSTRITAVEGNVGGQGVNTTDSPTFAGLTTTGDVVVQGSLTAQEMIISSSVTQVTTSFSEGSTIFGDSQDDTHQITGSLIVTGSIVSNGLGVVSSSNQIASTFAQTILDDADAGAVRTTIGVDAAGTDNSTNVTIASGRDYVSISGQELTLGQVDIGDDTNLIGGTGITLTGDTLSTTDSEIVHDDLSGFVSNEHIDHSGVSITTGTGLTGGGDITSTRTLAVDFTDTTLQSNISGSLGVNAAVIRSLTRAGITGSYNPRVTVLEGSGTIQGVGTTNSPTFAGLTIDGDISASGDITANNYIIKNQVTEMTTSFSQGNTIFGDTLDDRHEFTGSVFITGSLDVTQTGSFGRIEATTISASVLSVDASTIFVGDQTLTETIVGNIQNTTGTNTGDITLAGTPDYITINNQVLTRNTIDIGDDTNLVGGTGITLTGDTLTTTDSEIVHDSLSGFVANEHIDHTGVTLTAGIGLTGGGTIASNRTFDIDFTDSTLQNNISGSLGVNAAEIRTLTKAGISGSWRGELSSSSTTFVGGGVSGSVTSTGSFGRIETAGDLKVDGKITAQEFHTELTTATTIFESGSTQFGNSTDDIHRFTGSILVGSSSLSGSHQSTSSFGTYFGDGSNLTGISGYTVSNETNNRILTSTGTSAGNAEEFLTFDGSTLDVTGAITISGNVNANGNIVGDNSTTISGIDSVTATTLAGTISTATQNSITSATSLASVGTITTGVWNGTTIAVGSGGTGATTLDDLITLGNHTTGNYVATLTGGTGITSTGATSGEGIAHSISVDASQTQITAIGTITTGVWNGTAIANTYVADDLTISGGTINNTPIGATTPNTGNFTNTKISGSLIVSASGETLNVNDVFAVNESNDGTVFQVSDISGMPMLEVSSSGLTQLSNRNIKLSSTGIEVAGANAKISGSSTSTGSFGKIEASGLPLSIGSTNVGIGIASPASNITLKVAGRSEIDGLLVVSSSAIPVASSSLKVIGSGSLFKVLDKSNTAQLSINDTTIGTIFSLNDISGFSLLEVSSSGLVQISKQNVKMDSSGIEVVSGNISGSSTSTGSFGRLQASFLGGNSPIVIDADNISIDESGNITPPVGGDISGSATSTISAGDYRSLNNTIFVDGSAKTFGIGKAAYGGIATLGAWFNDLTGTNGYSQIAVNGSNAALYLNQVGSGDLLIGYDNTTVTFTLGQDGSIVSSAGATIGGTVQGTTIRTSNGGGPQLVNSTPNGTTPSIHPTLGDTNTGIGYGGANGSTADNINLITGGTTGLYIDSSQNVVIPAGNLNITDGNGLTLTNSSQLNYIKFKDSTDRAHLGFSHGSNDEFNIWMQENGAMRFATNNTQRMAIAATGEVGIGTASPSSYHSSPLVTYKASTNYLTIATDTDGISSILMSDGTTGDQKYRGQLEYKHDGDIWNFHAANSPVVTLKDGHMGIGTLTPNISSITGRAITLNAPTSGYAIFEFAENGARQGNINHYGDTMKMYNNQNGGLELGTNNSTRLTIAAAGDVSLTHDLSAANLSVAGNIVHTDNTNTKITFDTNKISMFSNNTERLKVADGVVNVIAMLSGSGEAEFRQNLLVDGHITGSSNLEITGNAIIGGTITAQEFRTEFVNDIVIETSGSTKFGNSSDDTHQFTGSINLDAGNISGSSTSTGSFGSLVVADKVQGNLELDTFESVKYSQVSSSNIAVHIKSNNADSSTSIVDSGPNGLTLTNTGVQHVTGVTNPNGYGKSSLEFGTNDKINIEDSHLFNFGIKDWTIEFWFRPATGAGGHLISFGNDSSNRLIEIHLNSANTTNFYVMHSNNVNRNGTSADGTDPKHALVDNKWAHVAFVAHRQVYTGYINGTAVVTLDATHLPGLKDASTGGFWLCSYQGGDGGPIGHMDDFRIVNNYAVYTGEFTPPVKPLGQLDADDTFLLKSIFNFNSGSNEVTASLPTTNVKALGIGTPVPTSPRGFSHPLVHLKARNPSLILESAFNGNGTLTDYGVFELGLQLKNSKQALTISTGSTDIFSFSGDGDFQSIGDISGSITSTGSFGRVSAATFDLNSIVGNWTNAGNTVADLGTITTVDINGGTIDSTPIGLSGTSTANFSNITGSALRIGGSTSKFSLTDTTPNGTANAVFGDAMFGSTSTTNTGITMFGTGQVGIAFGDAAFDRSGQFRYQHGTNKFEIITDNVIRETIDSVGISVTGKGIFSGDVEANGNIVGDGDTTISGINTIATAGNISGSSTSTGSFGKLLGDGGDLTNISPFPFTGSAGISGSLSLDRQAVNSGSTIFDVKGTQGTLFSVVDEMSGSIFSANTTAGIPVIEAFSNGDVHIGPSGSSFAKLYYNGHLQSSGSSGGGGGSGTGFPFTGSAGLSGSLSVKHLTVATGSTLLDVQGSEGTLFSVVNSMTGSIFSTSTAAGIPIIEAFSDGNVEFGPLTKVISGSSISTGSFGMLNIGTETLRNNFSSSLAGRVATLSAASSGITISNNVNNRVLTGDGTNANAESGLTYNGSSLGITGDISISDATPKITLNDTTDDNYGEIIVSDGGNLTITSDGDDAGSSYTRFDVGTGEVMRLKSGGNVGIGTTSPESKLHIFTADASIAPNADADELVVENSGNVGISILSGNTSNGAIFFGDAQDNNVGIIDYDHNVNQLSFTTGATKAMTINASSNVGIGTTSPAMPFHIVNSSGGRMMLHRSSGDSSSLLGSIMFGANDGDTNLAMIASYQDGAADAGNIVFETESTGGSMAERMRITSAGNVGIGASTPEAKLHVRLSDPSLTPAVSNVGMIIEENDHTYIELLTPNNKKSGVVFSDGQESGHIEYDHDTNSMNLKTGGSSNRVLIDSSGNVGVANTSPSEKLDVTGNIKASGTITAVGNLITQGDLIARNFIVSSSVTHMTQSFSSGSTIFGDTLTDTHKFTGSLDIVMSGSDALTIEGNTGPLFSVSDDASGSLFTVTDVSGVPAFDIDNEYKVEMGNPADPLLITKDSSGNTIISGSSTSTAKFGQYVEASSIAFKTNVETLENPLDKISKLRGVTYNLKSNNEPSIGMIAEEVNEVFPELVNRDDSGKPQAMSYTRMTAVLLEAVKELTEEVKELKKSNIYNKYKDKE